MTKAKDKILYAGFSPTLTEAQLARTLVEAIEQMAPSDSSVRLNLVSAQGGVKGILSVISSSGRFISEETSATGEGLLTKLSTQLCVQLDEWKRGRFLVQAV